MAWQSPLAELFYLKCREKSLVKKIGLFYNEKDSIEGFPGTSVECGNGKENMLKTGKKENQKRAGYVRYVAVILWLIMISLGLYGCKPKNQEPQWMEEQTAAEPGKVSQSAPILENETDEDTGAGFDMENVTEPIELYVHVCGAVETPGVYVLPEGSRVVDAVEAAGGALENASEEALNQALSVTDGMQIYVPTTEEKEKSQEWIHTGDAWGQQENISGVTASGSSGSAGKININTADVTTLCTLPGIGESRASSIVAYREEHGGFSTIEDIMKVSGIKDAAFGKIKDKICVK